MNRNQMLYHYICFLAFISLLLFLYGVLRLMTIPDRVLTGTEQYGSRSLVVDGQGNGDYTTIQAAIDAAQGETPSASSRWLVRVAPGEYEEMLTLYDYIDVTALGPGHNVLLTTPAAQPAINISAECTISNIRIGGDNDPVIKSGTFSGTLTLYNIVAEERDAGITFIQSTSGTIILRNCYIDVGGRLLFITTGTVKIYSSFLREYNTDGGGDTYATIEVDGAGTLEGHSSQVINDASAGSGGAALKITTLPTSIIFHNTLFRKATGAESIDTTVIPTIYLANCAANAAIDAAILGTHDIQVDANY
jgi:hypothetical protein